MMKIKFLTFALCIAILTSFGFRDIESDIVLPTSLKKEFLKTSNSIELKNVLITNFNDLFDNIHRVDVHFNSNEEYYYYSVYGIKDDRQTITLFKVSDEYALNETFPVLEKGDMVSSGDYCYYTPTLGCVPYQPSPIAPICGTIRFPGYCNVF